MRRPSVKQGSGPRASACTSLRDHLRSWIRRVLIQRAQRRSAPQAEAPRHRVERSQLQSSGRTARRRRRVAPRPRPRPRFRPAELSERGDSTAILRSWAPPEAQIRRVSPPARSPRSPTGRLDGHPHGADDPPSLPCSPTHQDVDEFVGRGRERKIFAGTPLRAGATPSAGRACGDAAPAGAVLRDGVSY